MLCLFVVVLGILCLIGWKVVNFLVVWLVVIYFNILFGLKLLIINNVMFLGW